MQHQRGPAIQTVNLDNKDVSLSVLHCTKCAAVVGGSWCGGGCMCVVPGDTQSVSGTVSCEYKNGLKN